MVDRPFNQAPEQSTAVDSFLIKKDDATNALNLFPKERVANSAGMTVADRGKFFRVNSSGDVESVAAGTTSQVLGWDSSGDLVAKAVPSDDILHVADEKTSGTDGGGTTAATWTTRTLNTVRTNEISGASLASNEITLPAGTYQIKARAPNVGGGLHRLRLYNVTDAAVILYGGNSLSTAAAFTNSDATIEDARFTLAATKNVRIDHYSSATRATSGLGEKMTIASVAEIYAEVIITKVST